MISREVLGPAVLAAVVAGGVTLEGAAPSSAATAPGNRCQGVLIAAHRGVHDAAHTENTARSAARAVAAAAHIVEGDMRQTRDGAWVMMHDATVDRTTNGHGLVRRLTLAQIRRLRTNDGVLGGVPTVEADLGVLDAHPTTGVQFEIKPARVSPRAMSRLMHIFARHHLVHRLTITSFNTQPLSLIRHRYPAWQTSYLTTRAVRIARAKSLGQQLSIEASGLTASYAHALRANGERISAWTVDNKAGWSRMIAYGVNTLVTNTVGQVKRYCAR